MKISFLAFRTVKGKLLGITLISAGAALLAAGAVLALYDYREMRQTLVTGTQTYANIVAQNCTAALSFGDANDAAQTLGSLRLNPTFSPPAFTTTPGKNSPSIFADATFPSPTSRWKISVNTASPMIRSSSPAPFN